MLTEIKNNYKSILNHFDFDESVSFLDHKKQKLIEMAENGQDRPKSQSCSPSYPIELLILGSALIRLTCKSQKSYCMTFHDKLKKIRPDWFIKSSDSKKQKLIEMAKNGSDKPKTKEVLGAALSRYTNECDKNIFDPEFNDLIRKLRPDWFKK